MLYSYFVGLISNIQEIIIGKSMPSGFKMKRTEKRSKILIYYYGHVGDTLVAYPAFRMIRNNYPDSELILLNYYATKHPLQIELFQNDDLFSEIHLLSEAETKIQFYLKFFKICLQHRYKRIFFFTFSESIPKVLSLAALILQFKKLTLSLYTKDDWEPIWKVYIKDLKKHGLCSSDDIFEFPLTDAELELAGNTAASLRKDQKLPIIAFGIGGKKPACLWRIENYIKVINSMKQNMDFIPVYSGGPSDREAANELIKACSGVFLQDTDCKSLRESMAFFKNCHCYIGNDTGTAHLAAAAGIKCAILYSAQCLPEQAWYPVGDGHLFIRKDISCAGCRKPVCPKGEFSPCMDLIKPEEVIEKLIPWLQNLS